MQTTRCIICSCSASFFYEMMLLLFICQQGAVYIYNEVITYDVWMYILSHFLMQTYSQCELIELGIFTCTVDAPLTDHIRQFRWYFSYLFELLFYILYFKSTVATLSISCVVYKFDFLEQYQYGLRVPFWNQKLYFRFTCFYLLAL